MSSTTKLFTDRTEAGRALATRMAEYAAPDLVVLGLPRGGVVVAAEVARALRGTLDVVVVRKIGVPWQPELALGAIAAVDEETFERAREREVAELRRQEAAYRQGRPARPLAGRPVIVVDDGLATGSAMRAGGPRSHRP